MLDIIPVFMLFSVLFYAINCTFPPCHWCYLLGYEGIVKTKITVDKYIPGE